MILSLQIIAYIAKLSLAGTQKRRPIPAAGSMEPTPGRWTTHYGHRMMPTPGRWTTHGHRMVPRPGRWWTTHYHRVRSSLCEHEYLGLLSSCMCVPQSSLAEPTNSIINSIIMLMKLYIIKSKAQ